MKLTFLISQGTDFLIGRVKEIPEIITQGSDIQEVKDNILDAIELYFEDMRDEAENDEIIYREELIFA